MKNWSKSEFASEAEKLSSAFVAGLQNGGASLDEMLVKSARDNNLNAEQIARLTRMTNVQTFNVLHKSKTAGDKYVEFSLGREENVLSTLRPTKEASASREAYPDLGDEIEAFRPGRASAEQPETLQKIASDIDGYLGPKERPDVEYMRWTKVADDLASRTGQSEVRWELSIKSILDSAKFSGWDHDQFEKSAVALYGIDCIDELNAIRESLHISDKLSPSSEKIAAVMDKLVATPSPQTDALGRAVGARKSYLKELSGQKVAAERADAYRRMIGA